MELEDLGPRLRRSAERVGPGTYDTVRHQATLLRMRIQANASGRPGPNVITGDYRASWRVEDHAIAHGGVAVVGTERPQGRRLEFGFWGMTDSIGRLFFQPPYPHAGPAVDDLSDRYVAVFRETLDDIFGGA